MKEYRGSLNGQPWTGWMPERPEELQGFVTWVRDRAACGEFVAVDTEGKGLNILSGDPGYVRLVQFGTATEAWVIPVERGGSFRIAAQRALEILPRIVGHNWIGFDALALAAYYGLDLNELCRKSVDTQILAKLIDPRDLSQGGIGAKLKGLAAHWIDPSAPDTQDGLTAVFRGLGETKETGWAAIDLYHPVYCEYAALDVILTARLLPLLQGELTRLGVPDGLVAYEHSLARICATMQQRGMVLDVDYTQRLSSELLVEESKHMDVVRSYGVEKVGSPQQVGAALVAMGEELTEKTGNGAWKVDKVVLARMAGVHSETGEDLGIRTPNPLALAVTHAKRASKWRTSWLDTFMTTRDVNGRIHPSINVLAARTSRMSITNPATQTLPSGDWSIRRCFLADPGEVMISTDFQAVELRVLAALADVRRMKQAIMDDADLHGVTASLVWGPGYTKKNRKTAKKINFGKVYGSGAANLAEQTGETVEAIQSALTMYDRAYPEIRQFGNRLKTQALANGGAVVSVTGRRLPLDRGREYTAINYAVQSAARDCLGKALLRMEGAGLLPYLRLPIHDEVLASVPAKDAEDVGRAIEQCMTFDLRGVPLVGTADIGGRSWGSLYMKDAEGQYIPELLIKNDEYFRANPAEAYAMID